MTRRTRRLFAAALAALLAGVIAPLTAQYAVSHETITVPGALEIPAAFWIS